SPVPQVCHHRVRLVPHKAEHRLQVSHRLAPEAARTEFGGEEFLTTNPSLTEQL
ncbi:hypothetical protein M9458_049050, partial [Cirrhinus mrigala]